jgi:DNA topoisomerase I
MGRQTEMGMRQAAKDARLRYVSDSQAGIRRLRAGKGFRYLAPNRKPIGDAKVLMRIQSLAIPPAWTQVWICPQANAHLQVTGRDARGRKQYRYHAHWRVVRDQVKYYRSVEFARALPAIRKRLASDLTLPGLPRNKVLALVVRLLELTFIRVGNEKYARGNGSFGLTTLRDRHVQLRGGRIRFRFHGKSGKHHDLEMSDGRLARVIRRCRDLPGYELFQYLDDDGEPHAITSGDVNSYLHAITGQASTAKDFRTWAGTLLCAIALSGYAPADSVTGRKKNVTRAIAAVALQLGNTPSICRKCYVHPHIVDSYLEGQNASTRPLAAPVDSRALRSAERAVLRFLEKHAVRLSQGRSRANHTDGGRRGASIRPKGLQATLKPRDKGPSSTLRNGLVYSRPRSNVEHAA